MSQEDKLDITIFEEDMEVLNDKFNSPSELGKLVQILINKEFYKQKEYYTDIIEYLLDMLEEEHYGSRSTYEKELKEEFNYEWE